MAYSIGDSVTITDLIEDMEFEGIVTVIDKTVNPEEYLVSIQPLGMSVRIDEQGKVVEHEDN